MIKLDEVLRSLSEPLSAARLEALRELLPQLEAQLEISQARLQHVAQSPSTRRQSSRRQDRLETQREALQEIQSYLTTLDLTIARVRNQIALGIKLQQSQQFTENIQPDRW